MFICELHSIISDGILRDFISYQDASLQEFMYIVCGTFRKGICLYPLCKIIDFHN